MVSIEWTPSIKLVSDMTRAEKAVVTTSTAHEFDDGEFVLVNVPMAYGMSFSNIQTKIAVIDSTSFRTEIDSRASRPFVTPVSGAYTPAQVAPITGNPTFYNSTPGSPS